MVDLGIENPTAQPIDVDLGQNGNEEIGISVIEPDGQRVDRAPPERGNQMTFFGKVLLDPGQSYRKTLVLNQWIDFAQMGEYTIQVWLKSSHAPATFLHLNITARDTAQLISVSSDLVSRIKSDDSAEDALAAVQALTYIRDPIVVSSWESLLHRPDFAATAASALAEIGNSEATSALISQLGASDKGTRIAIRSALMAIAGRTDSDEIRRRIAGALQSNN